MNLGLLSQLIGTAVVVTSVIYTLVKKVNRIENKAVDLIKTVKQNSARLNKLEGGSQFNVMGCQKEQQRIKVTLAILQHRLLYLENWEQKKNGYESPQINEDSFL